MTSRCIDTNHNVTNHLSALKAAGIETIIRYDNRLNPAGEKQIKPAEARAIAAAGMRLGIVYEGAGDQSGQFSDAIGYLDAKYARDQAGKRGQPDGSAEFFAVDFDANALQIRLNVIPYFQGVRRAFAEDNGLPKLRVGVYGSGLSCRSVAEAGLAELAWVSCSTGWTESHVFLASGKWNLRQHVPQIISGLDTDPNDINPDRSDIGDFVPFGGVAVASDGPAATPPSVAPPTPKPPPASTAMIGNHTSWVQAALNALDGAGLEVDGVDGPATQAAVKEFQAAHGLLQDGKAGPLTEAAMDTALKARAA
jgi:hypothetical protein